MTQVDAGPVSDSRNFHVESEGSASRLILVPFPSGN